LGEANDSLRQADQRRRQLLADISHELRTPTTAIRGEAEITLRGRDRSVGEYREALQRIVGIARQLGAVIDDLLAMARTDMDSLAVVREAVDVYEPLADAWASCGPLAAKAQVRLGALPIGPDTIWVTGDRQRLTQLFLLLLDNAVRYSRPQGEVRLHALHTQDDTGHWIDLSVVDQGIGIPSHELPLVFDRHFRGAEASAHAPSGSGLGLGIALRLAQSHGGLIHVQSPASDTVVAGQGSGTCVTLRLPVLTHHEGPRARMG
jgi:signal transduction histidine kinase